MRRKKLLKIFIPVSAVIITILILGSIYIYLEFRRCPFEQNLNPIIPTDMGVEEYKEDFEYFYNMIRDNYPFIEIKERMLGYNWLDFKDIYMERLNNCTSNTDFLEVLTDAIQALQNRHGEIITPSFVSDYRDSSLKYDKYPQYLVFSEEVVEANAYWEADYDYVMNKRNLGMYEVLMVYDRGEYIVYDGWSDWQSEYNFTLGSKILAVNGIPIHDAVGNSYESSYLVRDYARDINYFPYLAPRDLGTNPCFTILNTTGEIIDTHINSSIGITYSCLSWQGDIYPAQQLMHYQYYTSERAGYLYVGHMKYNPQEDYARLIEFYNFIADYDYLIIDIRGNPGGNDYYWLENIAGPLLKEEVESTLYHAYRTDGEFLDCWRKEFGVTDQYPKESLLNVPPEVLTEEYELYRLVHNYKPTTTVDFDGEIIVLTDWYVCSSSEAFSVFCKQTGFATLYGTNTGGDGIGHQVYFALPNSKLVIEMSAAIGLNEEGFANEEFHTVPDVYYESAKGNWSELIDYVLNDLN
jgi:hypothetical protein